MLSKKTKKLLLKTGIGLSLAFTGISIPADINTQVVEASTLNTTGSLIVKASSIWTYSKPAWEAKAKIYSKNTRFNVVKKIAVTDGYMYLLENGLYISANEKYVTFTQTGSVSESKLPETASKQTIKVLVSSIWTYNKPNWNAKSKVVKAGSQFSVSKKITVDGREMYLLDNGYYISANPKYVSVTSSISPPSTPAPTPSPTPDKDTGASVITIKSSSIWTYNKADWNAKTKVFYKGQKFNAIKKIAVNDGFMYLLDNGLYITANPKYVTVSKEMNVESKPIQNAPEISAPEQKDDFYQVTEYLNMRIGPGTTNSVVLVLPKNSKVNVISFTNGWAKITYNGKTGYVSMKYLRKLVNTSPSTPVPAEPTPSPAPVPEPTPAPIPEPTPVPEPTPPPAPTPERPIPNYVVTTANLSMRKGPESTQPLVGVIPKGITVKVLSVADNGWMEVSYEGVRGFSSGTYLKEVKDEDNVLLRTRITIDNLKSGDSVPIGSYAVTGTVSDLSLKELKVYINGLNQGTVAVNNGKYVYALNPALMNKEINTLRLEHSTDKTKFYSSVMLQKPSTNQYVFTQLPNNIDYYLQIEHGKSVQPVFWGGAARSATMDETRREMDASNFAHHDVYKYMFLDLSYVPGTMDVSAEMLNQMLVGKGVLEGHGESFIKAANEHRVNPFYLVAHALLETGNGKSILANGQTLLGTYQTFGNINSLFTPIPEEDKEKLIYNMYGIGAYDGNANLWGAQLAYANKWFTVEDAIVGGAKWISLNYINRASSPQNTLFRMRWNFTENMGHQYATDIQWAYKQANRIKVQLDNMGVTSALKFNIPVFQ